MIADSGKPPDPTGDVNQMKHVFCDCDDEHPTCYGCGKCHVKLLDAHNARLEMEGKENGKIVLADFETKQDFTNSQPEFGIMRWFCPTCENILYKDIANMKVLSLPDGTLNAVDKKVDLLTKLNNETTEMKITLNRVAAHLDSFSGSESPKRKAAKFAWGDESADPIRSVLPVPANTTTERVAPQDNAIQISYCDKVKLNLKTNDNVLKALHSNRRLVSGISTSKKRNDGSIDLLFKSFQEAQQAKRILEENMKNAQVSDPSLDKVKRFNLVGLTFEMSKPEVIESIMEENSSWLDFIKLSEDTIQIKDDPFCVITVKDVVKCHNNDIFRVFITMSQRLFAYLGSRKISVGFSKCKLYELPNHRRCFNCQRPGHLAKDCKHTIACSRCSLEHASHECSSSFLKCANCVINGEHNVNHASFSKCCPYNI